MTKDPKSLSDAPQYQAKIYEFKLSELHTKLKSFVLNFPNLNCLIKIKIEQIKKRYDKKTFISEDKDLYFHSSILLYAFQKKDIITDVI